MEAADRPGPDLPDENVGARIVSGGIWRVVAFFFATGMAVISTSVIARTLGPSDFGSFTTALSLLAIASALADLGLLQLGVREYAELDAEARVRSQRALIALRLLFTVIACTGIVLIAIAGNEPAGFVAGLAVAGLGLCFFSLQISYTVPLMGEYKLNALAGIDAARQLLASGLMIIAALASGAVGMIIATYLPVGLVLAVATGLLARGLGPLLPAWDTATMRRLMKDVGVFAIAASVGTVYGYAAQVVSHAVLNGYQSGQFALAFRVFSVLIGGCAIAVGGAFPLLVTAAREDRERMVFAARRLAQTTLLAGVTCTVGLVTGASFVIDVLGGSKFADAQDLVAITAVALPFSFLLITGSTVLLAGRRHRELVIISVTGAAVSIGATAVLAATFDATGAAWGLVLGEALISAGYLTVLARDDRKLLPDPGWVIAVVAAGALCCSAALLPVPGLVAAIIALAAFAAIILGAGLAPPEIAERLPFIGAGTID